MDIFDVLSMLGGLALFLYGMDTMGGALARMAGGKLEKVLEKVTSRRILAVLLGAGVTALIQSSSATTVMVVGFVNSGIMKLSRAVGIIMGANIGTTVTSWILSLAGIEGDNIWIRLLKPSSFSPVLAVIGIIMILGSKGVSKKKDLGDILLGFAILMFGMETMSSSVAGLAENPAFTELMTAFKEPLLGMLVGAVLTAIIQSSSASVGILQALCLTGAVNYSMAIPIIMGQNIGTCVTSLISSIGASRNAKRAAMIHLYFNLIGTGVFMAFYYALNQLRDIVYLSQSADPAGIAVIHSLFNICATLLLFPFSDKLVKLARLTIPDKKEETVLEDIPEETVYIDERILLRPSFAMELCRTKSRKMAAHTGRAISLALEVLSHYDPDKAAEVIRLESLTDQYEDVLGTYLVKLSSENLSESDSRSMSIILHSISDFERISDHALAIVESAREIDTKGLAFTKKAKKEINILSSAVKDICGLTVEVFRKNDTINAMHVEPLEKTVDTLSKRIKENHIKRLQKGKCSIEMGFILQDILTGLERVSDHCSNIAVEMITIYDNDYNTHEYFKTFSKEEEEKFDEEYRQLMARYISDEMTRL